MKAKNIVGKIYVSPMPIWGVLKHFVEAFKLQFRPLPLPPPRSGRGLGGEAIVHLINPPQSNCLL